MEDELLLLYRLLTRGTILLIVARNSNERAVVRLPRTGKVDLLGREGRAFLLPSA
jgi:hypothetical protein